MAIRTYGNKEKTAFTRMCIGGAVVELLKTTDYGKIRISGVVAKAGVARMTFYKYYDSVHDALIDYLHILIGDYLKVCRDKVGSNNIFDHEHILYAINYFDEHREFFDSIKERKLYSVIMEGVNSFLTEYFSSSGKEWGQTRENIDSSYVYKVYCYSGGFLNVFLKWEEDGRRESKEELARILYELYSSMVR